MPYGFNDDKSMFDLSDIGTIGTGTFEPNSNVVYSSDINVTINGTIGHISGRIRLKTLSGGKVGTIGGVGSIKTGAHFVNVQTYVYGRCDIILDTNGDLYIYPVYVSANDLSQSNYMEQFVCIPFECDED